jgi:16S rRNA (guanine527-N7)-methyltransferase
VSDFDELEDDRAFRERMREQAETAGLTLDLTWVAQFEQYFRLLRHWNRTINLTALPFRGLPGKTLNRLFIEPLQAARFVDDAPLVWFDLGSGGGSPAIPLKIVRPLLPLTMVESSRKAAFLGSRAFAGTYDHGCPCQFELKSWVDLTRLARRIC